MMLQTKLQIFFDHSFDIMTLKHTIYDEKSHSSDTINQLFRVFELFIECINYGISKNDFGENNAGIPKKIFVLLQHNLQAEAVVLFSFLSTVDREKRKENQHILDRFIDIM